MASDAATSETIVVGLEAFVAWIPEAWLSVVAALQWIGSPIAAKVLVPPLDPGIEQEVASAIAAATTVDTRLDTDDLRIPILPFPALVPFLPAIWHVFERVRNTKAWRNNDCGFRANHTCVPFAESAHFRSGGRHVLLG